MSTNAINLTAERRDKPGTRSARRLRRDGRIPAVVYGHQQEAASVTLPKKETLEHLRRGAHLFNLTLDGNSESVLLKDVQYDHLGDEVLHMDLFRVNLDEEITSEVPIVLAGEPIGARTGGILTQMRNTIELVAKVRDLPDELRIDVSQLEIGGSIHMGEVKLPAGVRLPEHEADFAVAMVSAPKLRGDDEAEDVTVAEPEIINQKKPADDTAATSPGGKKSPNA